MKFNLKTLLLTICAVVMAAVPAMATGVTDLPSLATSFQSDVTSNIWTVVPAAFTVIAILIGVVMLYRWIKKGAQSS